MSKQCLVSDKIIFIAVLSKFSSFNPSYMNVMEYIMIYFFICELR